MLKSTAQNVSYEIELERSILFIHIIYDDAIVLKILSRRNQKPDLHRTNDNQLKIKGPSFSFRLCGPESER